MRAKYQILAIPFRKKDEALEYAILKREDLGVWQGVAGGGEEGESVLESAAREIFEEIGIMLAKEKIVQLDTKSSIPVYHFKENWGENMYVINEYAFGADVQNNEIRLSDEHTEYKWCSYEMAMELLNWDSNKTALWELNERLRKNRNGSRED